ncbi:VOC family protein [Lacticaseibacillus saniviri]
MTILHHVSLLTASADQTTAFYTGVLGLRLIKNTVNQENVHMRHLFYGDNLGTPGSVVTFFEVPHLGHRYNDGSYLDHIGLRIPTGTAAFWQQRLVAHQCPATLENNMVTLTDPNDVTIQLIETDQSLTAEAVVDNEIPGANQITGLFSADVVAADVNATQAFFNVMLDEAVDVTVPLVAGQLNIVPAENDGVHRFGRGSMDHLAVSVDADSDLLTLATRAKQHGYTVEEMADRGWFKSLYVLEPNGSRIEFATMSPGFSLDEPLETMGQQLGLPPRFEPQRQEILNYFKTKGVDFHD